MPAPGRVPSRRDVPKHQAAPPPRRDRLRRGGARRRAPVRPQGQRLPPPIAPLRRAVRSRRRRRRPDHPPPPRPPRRDPPRRARAAAPGRPMIVDSHCHAWRRWPYQPPVPDPESRAVVEQLLWEMDRNGVDRAAVVCARIDHNPENNDYVAGCVDRHPDRLYQLADVDCSWTDTYHTPDAAGRLERAVERYRLRGFTHYVRADDDGAWFLSEDGLAFLEKAAELHQVASFAIPARLQPVLRQVAGRFPGVPFLCHHMAGARVADPSLLDEIVRSAELPNVHVKLSG